MRVSLFIFLPEFAAGRNKHVSLSLICLSCVEVLLITCSCQDTFLIAMKSIIVPYPQAFGLMLFVLVRCQCCSLALSVVYTLTAVAQPS